MQCKCMSMIVLYSIRYYKPFFFMVPGSTTNPHSFAKTVRPFVCSLAREKFLFGMNIHYCHANKVVK